MRTQELFDQAEGVLDTADIERVHDMRVASRRLRAVLEIFRVCFPAAEFKAALRDVKALADALGERRDPDVQLEALGKLAAELPAPLRPGVDALAERQRARQAAANATLAEALREAEAGDLRGRLLALAEAAA
jgi:CHAD domain-containing protein